MFRLNVEISGVTTGDIEAALETVMENLMADFIGGIEKGDTYNYKFDLTNDDPKFKFQKKKKHKCKE